MNSLFFRLVLCVAVFAGLTACSKKHDHAHDGEAKAGEHKHEHVAPHGGTAVVMGKEQFHLELVRDAATGKLSAYVLDGELENFIRIAAPSLEIVATVGGTPRVLVLKSVANAATGETVGDSSLFEGSAEWLKTTGEFDAVVTTVAIRGTSFAAVGFNFPKGNE